MSRYKYYFRKPKSEITKDILVWLALTGAVTIAATSPYFIQNIIKAYRRRQNFPKKKLSDAFYRLRKEGCIFVRRENHQIYISLTKEGRKKAGRFQIDCLKVSQPKKWDGKWRIVIFDIAQLQKIKRDAFRGKLRELGFFPLQKSIWIHPFKCADEINLLRDFFGLSRKDIRLITAEDIEDDKFLKKKFGL